MKIEEARTSGRQHETISKHSTHRHHLCSSMHAAHHRHVCNVAQLTSCDGAKRKGTRSTRSFTRNACAARKRRSNFHNHPPGDHNKIMKTTAISSVLALALFVPTLAQANPTYTLPEITIKAPSHRPVHATPSATAKPVLDAKRCYTRVDKDDGTRVRICEGVKK